MRPVSDIDRMSDDPRRRSHEKELQSYRMRSVAIVVAVEVVEAAVVATEHSEDNAADAGSSVADTEPAEDDHNPVPLDSLRLDASLDNLEGAEVAVVVAAVVEEPSVVAAVEVEAPVALQREVFGVASAEQAPFEFGLVAMGVID